jgi:chloramphenicol O-acetyltransferase
MRYEVRKLTPFRLLSIYAYEALEAGHNMYAQIEIDVTDIRKRLRSQRKEGRNVSFFAFLLSAIAKTIDDNREFNHIRCGKKIYNFDEVDIHTAIEMELDGVRVPRMYVVRDAAHKTMVEITQEIENAKMSRRQSESAGEYEKWAQKWLKLTSILPKWLIKFFIRQFSKNPFKIKERFGTTYVTSVSGFSDISGFIIPYFEGQNRPLLLPLEM